MTDTIILVPDVIILTPKVPDIVFLDPVFETRDRQTRKNNAEQIQLRSKQLSKQRTLKRR